MREIKKIRISIDKITDLKGRRYVVDVIIGILELENASTRFLLNSDVSEKTNNSTILRIFDKSMFNIMYKPRQHFTILCNSIHGKSS